MREAITDLSLIGDILKRERHNHASYAGYFCSYFPAELLYGFNIHPVRVLGFGTEASGNRTFMNYICSYLSDIIESFEAGHLDWADRLIVPASCDSLLGGSAYLEEGLEGRTKLFRQPLAFTPQYHDEYRAAVEEVLEWVGPRHEFNAEKVRQAVEEKNKLQRRIIGMISSGGAPFKGALHLKLMIAKSVFPFEAAMSFLDGLTKEEIQQNYDDKRDTILLMGPVCDNFDLIDSMNRTCNVLTSFMPSTTGLQDDEMPAGGDVVWDLVRYYFGKAGTATSFGYLQMTGQRLEKAIKDHRIKGIVYMNYKFCEPHMFFSRMVKKHVEGSGIKLLYLEIEHRRTIDPLSENKIDIFLENL